MCPARSRLSMRDNARLWYLLSVLMYFHALTQASPSPTSIHPTICRSTLAVSPSITPCPTIIKRQNDQQCLWSVQTWPYGGSNPLTTTVTQACTATPDHVVGTPIPLLENTFEEAPAALMPSTVAQGAESSPSAASSSPKAEVLGMDESRAKAVIIVLCFAILLSSAGFFLWGWEVGYRKGKEVGYGNGHDDAMLQVQQAVLNGQ